MPEMQARIDKAIELLSEQQMCYHICKLEEELCELRATMMKFEEHKIRPFSNELLEQFKLRRLEELIDVYLVSVVMLEQLEVLHAADITDPIQDTMRMLLECLFRKGFGDNYDRHMLNVNFYNVDLYIRKNYSSTKVNTAFDKILTKIIQTWENGH